MRLDVGIDPGLDGAISFLNGQVLLNVFDMPTQSKTYGKGREVDPFGLLQIFKNIGQETIYKVFVEQVGANNMRGRKQGASSMFCFGDGFGVIRAVLAALSLRHEFITPAVWKRSAGLIGKDKSVSLTMARRLYPGASTELVLAKHEGRAESILIAHFGRSIRP